MNKTAYELGFEQGYNDMIKEAVSLAGAKALPGAALAGAKGIAGRLRSGGEKLISTGKTVMGPKDKFPRAGLGLPNKASWNSLTDAEKKTFKRLGYGAAGTAGTVGSLTIADALMD